MFKRINLFFVFSAVIFIYFLTLGINFPYVGPNATNFNTYSLIAKNYNKFGYLQTKFAPIVSVSQSLPQKPEYYLHHPQLLSIAESLLFKIFGESFWVGRLTVIIFSFFSLILIYAIANLLKGKKFALITVVVSSFIPAFSIFGRMIGQEPLVLFFGLLFLFSTLKYLKTEDKRYLLLVGLSIIFGILSDWPMIYFVLSFIPYLIFKKRFKLIISLILLTMLVAISFIVYVYFLNLGLSELKSAFLTRSLGNLLSLELWPLKWFLTILLRLFVYFNPFLVLFAFISFYRLFLNLKGNFFSIESYIFLGLFLFGLIHILLYPVGSFGHPYWTYYFIPFVSFSSSLFFLDLIEKRKYTVIFFIFIASLIFLIKIEDWKIKEIESNIWRFELAKNADRYFYPYEKVLVNSNSLIDPDTLKYSFNHPVKVINSTETVFDKDYKFLYSGSRDSNFNKLRSSYKSIQFNSAQGEVRIFLLNEPFDGILSQENSDQKNEVKTTTLPYNENLIKKVYIFIKAFLNVPQI